MPLDHVPDAEVFYFDDVQVDCGEHRLLRAGSEQALEPKAHALLVVLLRRAGHVLSRDELLDAVWGRRFVTPGVLTRAVGCIRSALQDHADAPRYIQTVHTHGYRFIGVLCKAPDNAPAALPMVAEPLQVDEADENYALGLRCLCEHAPDSLEKALRRFRDCVRLDPGNARAHAKIAQCCLLLYEYGDWEAEAAFAQAREAIDQAQYACR